VDDAIIAVEMMVVKMEQGWRRARRRLRLYSTAFPMLTGTLITAAGFLPVGSQERGGEYTSRSRRGGHRPADLLGGCGGVHPLAGSRLLNRKR